MLQITHAVPPFDQLTVPATSDSFLLTFSKRERWSYMLRAY